MAKRRAQPPPESPSPVIVCALAWAIPGAGHLWLGRSRTGGILLVALPLMYGVGLWLDGQLFGVDLAQPLTTLSGLADIGIGVLYFVAGFLDLGEGRVVAATYEYGNTFLVVAGLLNALVVIDAYDIAVGRK
jgi:hypothetical protein